jgi:hypothetical protein
MKYTAAGMTTFLQTASERMQEDSEDIKAFCDFLTTITAQEEFSVQYSFAPNTLITAAPVWSFDVTNKIAGLQTRFFASFLQDEETAKRLIEDPYYMDISTWLPAEVVTKLGCAIENTVTDPKTKTQVPIQIIDNPLGFYTDPCRPLTWLITEHALQGKNLTIQEATLELFSIWEFAYLNPNEPPKPRPKKAGHLRLASQDGKIIDYPDSNW